ncbi:DUF3558 family protein [Amycolatopsis suaedae]|uniref:DUF3558 domain-containing protein n=1 Tax=Amycolatopsis suaedae TaxID=2510978 RepID=A0A4Q7J5Q6_9PSEU|nr:DUF3558 family protein [Amycolatopsis suaedae]RZQ62032.1 DUF3558 domain-containing protein [Amycolatopsis suaedae]
MKRTSTLLVLAAAGALAVGGCSSVDGTAKPAPGSAQPSTGASSPAESSSPAPGGDSPTAALKPCELVTAADLAPVGQFEPGKEGNKGGARVCDYDRASDTDLGIAIRDTQGIDEVQQANKKTGKIKDRRAVRAYSDGGCFFAIEVTPTSRVDVSVAIGDENEVCPVAEQVAGIVEAKLPKG